MLPRRLWAACPRGEPPLAGRSPNGVAALFVSVPQPHAFCVPLCSTAPMHLWPTLSILRASMPTAPGIHAHHVSMAQPLHACPNADLRCTQGPPSARVPHASMAPCASMPRPAPARGAWVPGRIYSPPAPRDPHCRREGTPWAPDGIIAGRPRALLAA